MKMKCHVICENSLIAFEEKLNQALEEGWELYGFMWLDYTNPSHLSFFQLVIKNE